MKKSVQSAATDSQLTVATNAEWRFWLALAVANLAFDAAIVGIVDRVISATDGQSRWAECLATFLVVSAAAQVVVLAIWAALLPGSNLLRVLLATLVLCLCKYLWEWISPWIAPAMVPNHAGPGLHLLPMLVTLFYCAQLPFWLLRFYGWRIVRNEEALPPAADTRRFTMLQMLGWAAFLSVVMGLGQIYEESNTTPAIVAIALILILCWLYGLIYAWATLAARSLLYGLAICLLASMFILFIAGPIFLWFEPRAPLLLIYQLFSFAQAGITVIGLTNGYAARVFGYRLTCVGGSPPS